ncbi:DUF4221 family protein [Pleomorphovibrio marinus]|uniref:DUF4221 family protein n=1 Tax=Pleomorphovibrio marinus TaxID=2164132 RepID=UPI000E0B5552|nr:DUF4221 family protein [Pleomorphovibrio marinus]
MRFLLLIVVLFIFISCQQKKGEGDSHDLVYSVDTVIIDSKDRLLDLKRGIWNSDLNDKESAIFLYNGFDHSIDEVNLDDPEIVNNYPFEAEGPDGTGEHVNTINLLNDSFIFIKSFGKSGVFAKNGSLIERVDWVNAIDSGGLKYGEIPQNEIAIGSSNLKVVGLNYDHKNRDVFLDVLSVGDNSVKRFDIESEKSYHNFVLSIDDPKNFTYLDPIVYLTAENDLILISHQFSNEIYQFNAEGEQIQTVHYEPKMTPKRAKDLSGTTISSEDQITTEYQKLLEQVRFGPPVWDRVKKRYMRLSAKRVFSEFREEGAFLPEIKDVVVYLSVFDEAFNLIVECAIPELSTESVKYFAKDGKLWVYQNFSDELGFVVIDF